MPDSKHILVIEDDADDIEFLSTAFSDNSLQVKLEILNRGDQINKYLENNKPLPQLIIMDLNLPKMHGRDVLCMIRGNPRFNKVPIAVLTTSNLEEDIAYCMKNGADKYFIKPSSAEEFKNLALDLYKMSETGSTDL